MSEHRQSATTATTPAIPIPLLPTEPEAPCGRGEMFDTICYLAGSLINFLFVGVGALLLIKVCSETFSYAQSTGIILALLGVLGFCRYRIHRRTILDLKQSADAIDFSMDVADACKRAMNHMHQDHARLVGAAQQLGRHYLSDVAARAPYSEGDVALATRLAKCASLAGETMQVTTQRSETTTAMYVRVRLDNGEIAERGHRVRIDRWESMWEDILAAATPRRYGERPVSATIGSATLLFNA